MDETLNFTPLLSPEPENCRWDDADETQIILNIKGRIFLSSLRLSGLTGAQKRFGQNKPSNFGVLRRTQ